MFSDVRKCSTRTCLPFTGIFSDKNIRSCVRVGEAILKTLKILCVTEAIALELSKTASIVHCLSATHARGLLFYARICRQMEDMCVWKVLKSSRNHKSPVVGKIKRWRRMYAYLLLFAKLFRDVFTKQTLVSSHKFMKHLLHGVLIIMHPKEKLGWLHGNGKWLAWAGP